MIPWIIVARDQPYEEPYDADCTNDIKHKGPTNVGILQNPTGNSGPVNRAHQSAGINERRRSGSFLRWGPLSQKHVYSWVSRALAHTHKYSQNYEGGRVAQVDGSWGQHGEDGSEEDPDTQGVLTTVFLGDDTTR